MSHIQFLNDRKVRAVFQQPSKIIHVGQTPLVVPFASPADWRDHWIYFLLVDRFNNPKGPPAADDPYLPYQGGGFDGIKKQLDYLHDLGVGAIWLSPVQYNPQWFKAYYGGYGIQDLLRIEPRFCKDPAKAAADPQKADDEFRDLVDHCHAKGIYVIADIVLNHMGDLFNYEGMADDREWNPYNTYSVYWRDACGRARGDWPVIEEIENLPRDVGPSPRDLAQNAYFRRRGANGPNLTQGDFYRLKELYTEQYDAGTATFPVRDMLTRAYAYFMARFDIDGYRIDTLQYVNRQFARTFGNAMREYALGLGKKNFLCFGEVWDDDNEDQIANFIGRNTETDDGIIGVDTVIDFPMRKRLVNAVKNMGSPGAMADHYQRRCKALKRIASSHGDASGFFITFLDNHDLNERIHTQGQDHRTLLALTCLFTMAGIPCVYYGTEQGLDGHGATRESVREALWGHAQFKKNHPFYKHLQALSRLRVSYPALRYGRQYFRPCSGDGNHFGHSDYHDGVIAFSRILGTTEIVVAANTSPMESRDVHILVDRHLNHHGHRFSLLPPYCNQSTAPDPVIHNGRRASIGVHLEPMEAQVLGAS